MQYNSAVGSSWCLKLVKVASYLFTFLHIKCAAIVIVHTESHCKIGQQLSCFYDVYVMTFCTLPHEKFNWLNPLSLWRPCKAWHIGVKIFFKTHLNFVFTHLHFIYSVDIIFCTWLYLKSLYRGRAGRCLY